MFNLFRKSKLPKPLKVDYADTCRDGGSYSIGFINSKSEFYSLELPVKLDSSLNRVGYKQPYLIEYGSKNSEISISWRQAEKFANQLNCANHAEGINKINLSAAIKLLSLKGLVV